MSEKRFGLIKIDDYVFQIRDIDNDFYLVAEQICDLLNEQQATISALKEENKELEDEHDDFSNFLIDKGLEFEFEKWCKDE